MDIKTNWEKIRLHFNKSFRSNFHVSIASVDSENNPTVTPIGSLFLKKIKRDSILRNFLQNYRLTLKQTGGFWIKSLFKGKFNNYPAIKLYGELGQRREATEIEISRLNKRMKTTKGMKGNRYLWGDMKFVRDITFTKAEKINLGKMTKDL